MPKRTRTKSQDINQFAASIVAQSTGSALPVDLDNPLTASQIMREMGRRGGLKGAATLNARLSPAQRKASARRAAQARWGKKA
ncbi:MAG: histone H1 [Acidobacteriia bacterium]|nr:histone H1 [Terriglobia bacterium]